MAMKDFGGSPYPVAPAPPPPSVSVQRPRVTAPAPKPRIVTNSQGSYVKPSAPAAPSVPSMDVFLNQDSGYQQQLREFAKSLNDFNADVTRRRGSLDTQYGVSQKAMNDQSVIDLDALKQDYGARGMLRSGLYGDAVGNYNTEFDKRMADLDRQQQNAIAALTQEQGQFGSSEQLKEQAAKEAAIRRRAEQYGI